jgi:hypothetical protein
MQIQVAAFNFCKLMRCFFQVEMKQRGKKLITSVCQQVSNLFLHDGFFNFRGPLDFLKGLKLVFSSILFCYIYFFPKLMSVVRKNKGLYGTVHYSKLRFVAPWNRISPTSKRSITLRQWATIKTSITVLSIISKIVVKKIEYLTPFLYCHHPQLKSSKRRRGRSHTQLYCADFFSPYHSTPKKHRISLLQLSRIPIAERVQVKDLSYFEMAARANCTLTTLHSRQKLTLTHAL